MAQNWKYITTEMFAALKPGDQLYCHTQLTMAQGQVAAKAGELYPINATPYPMYRVGTQITFHSLHDGYHILTSKAINEWFGLPLTDDEVEQKENEN